MLKTSKINHLKFKGLNTRSQMTYKNNIYIYIYIFYEKAYSSEDRAPDSDFGCRGFESLLAYVAIVKEY